jgi:mono/diheme cytochrome c family protein
MNGYHGRLILSVVFAVFLSITFVYATDCPLKSDSWDTNEIKDKLAKLTPSIVEVSNDPLFGGVVKYDGFLLRDLLAKEGISPCDRRQQITFKASDGYTVKRPLEDFIASDSHDTAAYLAIGEHGATPDALWRTLKEGREDVTPAPYALIWSGDYNSVSKNRPWPHMIIEIAFSESGSDPRTPGDGAPVAVKKGADLFTANCSACHSINLSGGIVGPELNVPMNITEYWEDLMLRKVITEPTAVRAGSRMPSFSHLSGEDLTALIEYLSYMKDKKLCVTAGECANLLLEK